MIRESVTGWAEAAYLRSCTSCGHAYCHSFSVEEALFMLMFWIWVEEYGPGWEGAIE